jgi:dTDP-4-dehydrorhamnose reductase
MKPTTILILGGTGLLGHVLFRALSRNQNLIIHATVRNLDGIGAHFTDDSRRQIHAGVDANYFDTIIQALSTIKPNVVINCIGLIKQLPLENDPLSAITLNAQLPHLIALACLANKARLIHFSTDCVFNGRKGGYSEKDVPNAEDLYGQTKMLGEVKRPHCLTLRGSFIGHELKTRFALVDWFLAQTGSVKGYTKAIYSGTPTVELARIIEEIVLPNRGLQGLYNISSTPISKHDLLQIVARRYGKRIIIEPYDDFVIDRSLDSTLFKSETGYTPPSWENLIENMHADYLAHAESYHAFA